MQNTRFECYKHLDPNPSEDVAICPHHHAFYEIIFVVEGDFFYEVEGRPYHLSHGDVILIDELQFHHGLIYHSKGYERYALWIHPKYMQRLAQRFPKLDPQYCFLQLNSDNNNIIHLDDATFAELQQDLAHLFESYWSKTPSDEVLSESYFAIILTKLNQIVHHQQNGEEIPTISAESSHISDMTQSYVSNDMGIVYHSVSSPKPQAQMPSLQDAMDLKIKSGQTLSDQYNKLSHKMLTSASVVESSPKFTAVQSMHEMINTVNQQHETIITPCHSPDCHGTYQRSDLASLEAQGSIPNRCISLTKLLDNGQSLLPSNIASTGKDEAVAPFGYISICPHSRNCTKHAYFNELLLLCLDTGAKLVSFAPSLGDNQDAPSSDVSIFDPDPELDNYQGQGEHNGTFHDIYTDSFLYDEDEEGTQGHSTKENKNTRKQGNKLAPCTQKSAQRAKAAAAAAAQGNTLPCGKKRQASKDTAASERERTGHDFQTLIMQGEGEAPAPLLSDGAMPGFAIPMDDDEMHLNLKLSERLKLSALLKFINLNINENLSLDEISLRFNLSKFYLTRRFKELTGLSLHQFIVKKRLTRARYLISVGMDPYRAAVEAGFNNYSHFSRTFKGYFGQNPSTIPQAKAIHIKSSENSAPETTAVEKDPNIRQ